jgi:PAS domain S-box-containing protein
MVKDDTSIKIKQDLEESRKSEALLASLLENSSQPFGVGYPDGRLGLVNKAFEELTGYSREELKSTDWSEILTPYEFRDMENEKLEELQRTGQPIRYEKEYIRKDSTIVPIELLVHIVKNKDGKPKYYYSFITDITERKHAEQYKQEMLEKEKRITEELQNANEELQQKEKDMGRLYTALRKSEKSVRLKLKTILSPEGDIGKLDLADILDVKAIQSLMDNYYKTFQLPMAMIDTKGEVLAGVGWQDICTQFHRVNHETKIHCIESDIQLTTRIPKGEFKLYKCKNNMWDVATPIIVGGKHLGNIFSGQFFFDDEKLDYELFRKQAKKYDFDEEKYISALEAAPKVSRQAVNEGMAFFIELADMISSMSYSNLNLARSLKERDKLLENEQQLTEKLQTSNEELQAVTEELQVSNEELQNQGEGLVHINQALLESEKRLNRSQEIAHLGSWELDIDNNCLSWSDEVYRIFGLQPQEFDATYDAFLDYVHPDDRKAVDEAYSGSIREGQDTYEIEHRIVRKSTGKVRIVHEKCEHFRDSSGRIVRSVGMVHDITERIKAEKALNESEKKYRNIIELANEGIMMADPSGIITFVNSKMAELLGYTIEELVGTDSLSLVDKDEVELGTKKIENRKKGIQESYEIKYRRKTGEELWCLINATPMYDNNGKHIANMTMQTDITERKQVEEERNQLLLEVMSKEEELSALIENIVDEIWFCDVNGNIILANAAARRFEKERELKNLNSVDKLISRVEVFNADGSVRSKEDSPIIRALNDEILDLEDIVIFPNTGKKIYRQITSAPIKNNKNEITGAVAVVRDITKRKKVENNLKTTMDELKQSNKELEQFAYITSHDLREPLRMITSFLQLLERRYKDQLDEDANEFIGFAVDGAKRLDAMTNDLLQYSKITNKKREIKPVNFEQVLEEALINLQIQIEENNAIITHDPLPTINGDEQLKVQLFQNIIGNAIKYRNQETAKIHISATKEKNQYLFSIKDNGIGMSPEHLKKIFTIFQRLHTHEEYEGTGIGLAIAQKIVHQQGGQIWAESELGKGTTFYFTIPINT